MAAIEKFEDLIAWQKSKSFAVKIYSATDEGKFSKDFGLRDQIRRASISIVSNIAEGFERKGNKEFLQFLFYSLGSIAEVKTQLIISFELNYISKEKFDELNDSLVDIEKNNKRFSNLFERIRFKGF